MLLGGWNLSPSKNVMPHSAAIEVPRVDLPLPLTPIRIITVSVFMHARLNDPCQPLTLKTIRHFVRHGLVTFSLQDNYARGCPQMFQEIHSCAGPFLGPRNKHQ